MNNLYVTLCAFFVCCTTTLFSQEKQIRASLFEGTVVAGYVDRGAYLNCTGPGVKYIHAKKVFLLGLLPGIRMKEDNVADGKPKNTWITPSLGFGLTASIGHLALQLPTYYTAKTATADGSWKLGFGLGYRF
ncbi:hypothetical protein PQ465_18775 [Sphingobacterium oryzagri]|uniref:Outer membrane insertion C-terminal signal n=1 Tax=Sphingobacterium oryzagri TaxID=3025669 RepID=A0ABY7WIX8_9SPHI|nr:hypothetical protein [Sphingobacterium sp. KACC 22765]WDF68323.1 hypothetical protein PQ465_18775 [Sphingobacterium sp. KACC 22765]